MAELKPCPFCGGEAKLKTFKSKVLWGTKAYYVRCSLCKVGTALALNTDDPIEAWNRRSDGK